MSTQKQEIIWHVINSCLAGAISFLSAMAALVSTQGYDSHDILTSGAISLISAGLVAVYKFKDYWDKEESEYRSNILSFY